MFSYIIYVKNIQRGNLHGRLQKQREDIIEEQKHGRYIKLNLDGRYKKEELTKIFNDILNNY